MREVKFSKPSKPACLAYSLPAWSCKTGSKLRECKGTVCSKCYACKGFYVMPNVKTAMQARLDEINAALSDPIEFEATVRDFCAGLRRQYRLTMRQIERTGEPGKIDGRYFRWHDAGDLQSVEHFALVCEIARRTPEIKHKIPTKEYRFVETYLQIGGTIPKNLAVLLSLYRVDGVAPQLVRKLAEHEQIGIAACHTTTEPLKGYLKCPATEPGADHTCTGCRRCWEPGINVSYRQH